MKRATETAMRIHKILSAAILAVGCLITTFAHGQEAPFSLKITGPSKIKAGQELRVDIQLVNQSDHKITVLPAKERDSAELGSFDISVRDLVGNAASESKYRQLLKSKEHPFSTRGKKTAILGPGEEVADSVLVDQLYALTPGKYGVQVERKDPDSKKIVRSNTLVVTVEP